MIRPTVPFKRLRYPYDGEPTTTPPSLCERARLRLDELVEVMTSGKNVSELLGEGRGTVSTEVLALVAYLERMEKPRTTGLVALEAEL